MGPLKAIFVLLFVSLTAHACPFCYTDLGQQVRAGIFNGDFGRNLAFTCLPFAVFLFIVAAVQWFGPQPKELSDGGIKRTSVLGRP